jgi:hypothetical protein
MSGKLRDCRILGIHRVVPSEEEFDEALEVQWGQGLTGAELERARSRVREHFDGLCLIEVQFEPADAEIDWNEFTQCDNDLDRSSWQVPYDEVLVDRSTGRWAFFLHFVRPDQPLLTPVGERLLPRPSLVPAHLIQIKYEVPG